MDLIEHLRAFVAVAEESHVTRAAERLGSAQPVVSRRLQALEQHLGIRLFDRVGRGVRPTRAAEALVPEARDLVERSDRFLAGPAAGDRSLRLGVPALADTRGLADAIAAARDAGLALELVELTEAERRARVAGHDLDAALVRVPIEQAAFVVPLGFGVRQADAQPEPVRRLHLGELRPRRDGSRPPEVFVQPEDQFPALLDRLHAEAVRAGLGPTQLVEASSGTVASARALSGHDLVLCSRAEAYRYGLVWRPSAAGLLRGYGLRYRRRSARLPDTVVASLRHALGGRVGQRAGTVRDPGTTVPDGVFG